MELQQLQPSGPLHSRPLRRARTEDVIKRSAGPVGWGSAGDQSMMRHDREEKEKQKKKAQLMLHTWEIVAQKEKREKESKLKERVALQRQLITKCEQFIEEKNMTELQKNMKRKEEEMAKRKLLTTSLLQKAARQQRVNACVKQEKTFVEPKKKNFSTYNNTDGLANKDEEHKMDETDGTIISPSSPPEERHTAAATATDGRTGGPMCSTLSEDGYINIEPLLKRPENRIAKFIGLEMGEDVVKMDELWNGLKVHGRNQLKPLREYVKHLKSISGPSTKECMEEYEKPLPTDIYSGKSMLLMTVLAKKRRSNPPNSYYIVKHNRTVASDKTAFGQRLVDRMRSASNMSSIEDSANWFTLPPKETSIVKRPVSAPVSLTSAPIPHSPSMHLEDIENLSYLTDDGKITSASKSKNKSYAITSGRSSSRQSTSEDIEESDRGLCRGRSSSSLLWQPLSFSALKDYRGVKQRVLSGHGKFNHGDTKLWKPHV